MRHCKPEFMEVAAEVVRERVVTRDRAVIDRLFSFHPERYCGPQAETIAAVAEPVVEPVKPPPPVPPVEIAPVVTIPDEEWPPPIALKEIIKVTAKYFQITSMEIRSHRRERRISVPRQIAMYLCRMLTMKSYPEIGRALGGRDHTTCMYGARAIETRRPFDPELNEQVLALAKSLGAELA